MLKVRKVCTLVMYDQDQPIPLTTRLLGYLALDLLHFCVCETGTTGAGVRPVMMVLFSNDEYATNTDSNHLSFHRA